MILEELIKNHDEEYKKFHSSLVPDTENIIGVRAPIIKSIAKKYANTKIGIDFLKALPHKYYDENMVHGYMLGFLNEPIEFLKEKIVSFLPYMDNWAVVDSTVSNLKNFFKNREDVYDFIKNLTKSEQVFTVRFALVSLLCYYVDNKHIDEILKIVSNIKREEYYIKMAQAWLVSVCIIKQYEKTVQILENNILDIWTHNKSISKSIESFRVSKEQKDYLKTLRRKNRSF